MPSFGGGDLNFVTILHLSLIVAVSWVVTSCTPTMASIATTSGGSTCAKSSSVFVLAQDA